MGKPKVIKIALSGGPGGGKDGLYEHLMPWLESLGFYVIYVPEAATEVMNAGIHWSHQEQEPGDFQAAVLRHIITTEDLYEEAALRHCNGKDIVMLCNRGAPEIEAYIGRKLATEVLGRMKLTRGQLLARYNAVIFMVTAADGAPKAYEKAKVKNPKRTESLEQAIDRDRKTQRCWLGAESLSIIRNTGDSDEAWQAKVQMAQRAIGRKLGIPMPLEIERKFRLPTGALNLPVEFEEAEIEQIYLVRKDPSVERRIRRRIYAGHVLYFYTEKVKLSSGVRNEEERRISWSEYDALMAEADSTRHVIRKRRRYFLYNDQYFELDVFGEPRAGLYLLEIELLAEDTPVQLPPWWSGVEDVTDDPQYSNSAIARAA